MRVDATHKIAGPISKSLAPPNRSAPVLASTACGPYAAAKYYDSVPGGGTLNLMSFMDPSPCVGNGKIAFVSQIAGAAYNQGIFWADTTGIHPIVFGSGGGGGSGQPGSAGDPSPIGGKFAGFFEGSMFAPAINAGGDILFIADIYQGSSPRGLFLYKAASASFVKVAAVGDPSPAGGTITEIGPGSMNDPQDVLFAATRTGGNVDILRWTAGVVTKMAAVGDPAPGGGTFQYLVTEALGFVDGTFIPTGPIPAINNSGTICFRAYTNLGGAGLIMKGAHGFSWMVRNGYPTPGGGTYVDFQAPCLNSLGQITFFADVMLGPGNYTSGWFAGAPGAWRKVVMFYDTIGGAQCYGLTYSRNPVTPIDDAGNVVVWMTLQFPDTTQIERILLNKPDGSFVDVATQGAPTPIGGVYGSFDILPSMSSAGAISWGGFTPGASGAVPNAMFIAPLCPATIANVSPAFAPNNGGSTILINGANFTSASAVKFGAANATFSIVNDTQISAALPAAPGFMGYVDVTVTTPNGTAILTNGFDYFVRPKLFGTPTGAPSLSWESTSAPIINKQLVIDIDKFGAGSLAWFWAGDSNTNWAGVPLPLDCGPVGLPGCILLASGEYVISTSDPNPKQSVVIPNDNSIVGYHVFFQAFILDGTTSNFVSTDAYEVVLGP